MKNNLRSFAKIRANSSFLLLKFLILLVLPSSCSHKKKVYTSNCDEVQTFVKISYAHLMDSLNYFDQQYVEISGRYREGKEQSALYDSALVNTDNTKALWVNFSQDCPLYLQGTQHGFFEYADDGFARINNKKVRIRGKVDVKNHGHLKQYKACIDRISMIEL